MVVRNISISTLIFRDLQLSLPQGSEVDLGRYFSKQELKNSKSLISLINRKILKRVRLSAFERPVENLPEELKLKLPTKKKQRIKIGSPDSLSALQSQIQERPSKLLEQQVVRKIEHSFEEL